MFSRLPRHFSNQGLAFTSALLIGAVVLMSAALIPIVNQFQQGNYDDRSEASGIDNCCQVNRSCSTDQEWLDGYWAYQNDSSCGQGGGQTTGGDSGGGNTCASGSASGCTGKSYGSTIVVGQSCMECFQQAGGTCGRDFVSKDRCPSLSDSGGQDTGGQTGGQTGGAQTEPDACTDSSCCTTWCGGCGGFCGDEGVKQGLTCNQQADQRCGEKPCYVTGTCDECDPSVDTKRCSGTTLQTCNDQGGWVTKETNSSECPGGQLKEDLATQTCYNINNSCEPDANKYENCGASNLFADQMECYDRLTDQNIDDLKEQQAQDYDNYIICYNLNNDCERNPGKFESCSASHLYASQSVCQENLPRCYAAADFCQTYSVENCDLNPSYETNAACKNAFTETFGGVDPDLCYSTTDRCQVATEEHCNDGDSFVIQSNCFARAESQGIATSRDQSCYNRNLNCELDSQKFYSCSNDFLFADQTECFDSLTDQNLDELKEQQAQDYDNYITCYNLNNSCQPNPGQYESCSASHLYADQWECNDQLDLQNISDLKEQQRETENIANLPICVGGPMISPDAGIVLEGAIECQLNGNHYFVCPFGAFDSERCSTELELVEWQLNNQLETGFMDVETYCSRMNSEVGQCPADQCSEIDGQCVKKRKTFADNVIDTLCNLPLSFCSDEQKEEAQQNIDNYVSNLPPCRTISQPKFSTYVSGSEQCQILDSSSTLPINYYCPTGTQKTDSGCVDPTAIDTDDGFGGVGDATTVDEDIPQECEGGIADGDCNSEGQICVTGQIGDTTDASFQPPPEGTICVNANEPPQTSFCSRFTNSEDCIYQIDICGWDTSKNTCIDIPDTCENKQFERTCNSKVECRWYEDTCYERESSDYFCERLSLFECDAFSQKCEWDFIERSCLAREIVVENDIEDDETDEIVSESSEQVDLPVYDCSPYSISECTDHSEYCTFDVGLQKCTNNNDSRSPNDVSSEFEIDAASGLPIVDCESFDFDQCQINQAYCIYSIGVGCVNEESAPPSANNGLENENPSNCSQESYWFSCNQIPGCLWDEGQELCKEVNSCNCSGGGYRYSPGMSLSDEQLANAPAITVSQSESIIGGDGKCYTCSSCNNWTASDSCVFNPKLKEVIQSRDDVNHGYINNDLIDMLELIDQIEDETGTQIFINNEVLDNAGDLSQSQIEYIQLELQSIQSALDLLPDDLQESYGLQSIIIDQKIDTQATEGGDGYRLGAVDRNTNTMHLKQFDTRDNEWYDSVPLVNFVADELYGLNEGDYNLPEENMDNADFWIEENASTFIHENAHSLDSYPVDSEFCPSGMDTCSVLEAFVSAAATEPDDDDKIVFDEEGYVIEDESKTKLYDIGSVETDYEFFANFTEHYFYQPEKLQAEHPQIYEMMDSFWGD